ALSADPQLQQGRDRLRAQMDSPHRRGEGLWERHRPRGPGERAMTMSPLQSTRPVAKPVVRGRLRSVLTALVLATAVAPPLLYTDVASAQDERSGIKRVAVGSLTGSKTESARGWLVEGLEEQSSLEVLSGGDAAAIEHGASESEIAAHAAQLQADAVVLGTSNLKPKVGWVAEIYI